MSVFALGGIISSPGVPYTTTLPGVLVRFIVEYDALRGTMRPSKSCCLRYSVNFWIERVSLKPISGWRVMSSPSQVKNGGHEQCPDKSAKLCAGQIHLFHDFSLLQQQSAKRCGALD
jgi:hypothetical protein